MLHKETTDGIKERIQSLNPSWLLGAGAEFEHLTPYGRKIALMILTEVFYRSFYGNENRTIEDLYDIAKEAIAFYGLESTRELEEKIVDNLLWSKGKSYDHFSFRDETYDDRERSWVEHRFQYLTVVRLTDGFDKVREIYELTDESEDIVIKSQELEKEMDITIQGIISEMYINKGKFKQALNSLQNLNTRVLRLIEIEIEHEKDILKNPKRAIYLEDEKWMEKLEEVRDQFREEQKRYDEMERILRQKLAEEEGEAEIKELIIRVSLTRSNHDKLAHLVIGNIEKEFHFRTDEDLFTKLWNPPDTNFKTTVMEEKILPKGLAKPEDLFPIMHILFSPKKGFLYPLEWMVKEQGYLEKEVDFDEDGEDTEKMVVHQKDSLNWEEMTDLWAPFIVDLLENGEVSVTEIMHLPDYMIERWVMCREAFDIWVLFWIQNEKRIYVSRENLESKIDHRLVLLRKLMEKNFYFEKLIGKEINISVRSIQTIRIADRVEVAPFKLRIT
ncbi:hypothetical protein ACLM5H_16855 [Fredinandcohnia humi]